MMTRKTEPLLIFLLLVEYILGQNLTQIYPDYRNHSCRRTCDGTTKICEYVLTLDTFYTMQPECLNCTTGNERDCENPQCIPADGQRRSVQTINGILPGPALIVCHGDTIKATVVNRLYSESTTIHWHGIHQKKSPFMDGVPMVTQCPINPDSNFTYIFDATEVGTYFYHSHLGDVQSNDGGFIAQQFSCYYGYDSFFFSELSQFPNRKIIRCNLIQTENSLGFQRGNGVYGPLIIHENNKKNMKSDLYDFDLSDHIMCVMDWHFLSFDDVFFYHERNKISAYKFIDGLMINGRVPTPNNTIPPTKFYVKKDHKYRFRVIHTGVLVTPIEISIDGHRLTVISSDGSDIKPVTVDRFTITNGERYDFVLNADQPVDQYAIRLNASLVVSHSGLAVLVYEGAKNKTFELSNHTRTGTNLNCINTKYNSNCYQYDNLTSVETSLDIKGDPDYKFYFVTDFSNTSPPRFAGLNQNKLILPYINYIRNIPAASPLLTHPEASEKNWCNYDTRKNCTVDKLCNCLHLVQVKLNKLVEMIFVDFGITQKLSHPFHLHGYKFKVIGQDRIADSVTFDTIKELDENNKLVRKFHRSMIKDTVVVPSGGYTIIRFIADNPGYWLLHCHVDLHSQDGMELVLLVGNKRERILQTPKNFPTCGNY